MCKKNSTDKTRGVQSSDSEKPLGNYLNLLILLYTQKHALQLCGRCIIQCNTGSTSTSTRFLSSTVEQQINDTHFAVALGANTQQKCPKKIFCWVSNFEHFEAIIHLVILFDPLPCSWQMIMIYKTYYIWNNLYYMSLCLSGLDNVISNFCTVWTCSKKFKQPVITLDLETWFTGLSVQTVYACIWSILLNSAIPHSS